MNPFAFSATVIVVSGFAASAALTPVVRSAARRARIVALPKSDRWHAKPTAMMGGVAIFLAAIATILILQRPAGPNGGQSWVVLAASAWLFAVGLIDDFLHIKPYQKLIGQVAGAAAVIYAGLVLPWTSSAPLNIAVTFIWIIGLTNAVNMLDNMDGLAAGISAVAAIFLAINFYNNHQPSLALMLGGFAAALLGFLVYNHHPASIFMGDCGSMFVGFFLATSALLSSSSGGGRSRSVLAVMAVPVLVLCVPIFDTTFVTVMRKLAGRAASQGGRDHTSHRLVALGLSEKHAVWMLYALAISSGSLALLVRYAPMDISVATIGAFVIVMTFLGIHLGRVRVYEESELAAARERPLVAFLFDLTHKRRIFEVILDAVLIALAYYFAYALKFGFADKSADWQLFLRTLPIVICLKLATFLAAGVYRGIWRYASVTTVFEFARAVALSSVVTIIALVFAFRFDGFSRRVFVLDAVLLMMILTGSRFSFRILRRLFPMASAGQRRRMLIYGAGDAGELVYRELLNNGTLDAVPVAFADDDPAKVGRIIHGLRVYSAAASIVEVCRRLKIDEVLISTAKIAPERLALIVGECAAGGLPVTRAHMNFQRLSAADFGWVLSSDTPATAAPLIAAHGPTNLVKTPPRPTVNH